MKTVIIWIRNLRPNNLLTNLVVSDTSVDDDGFCCSSKANRHGRAVQSPRRSGFQMYADPHLIGHDGPARAAAWPFGYRSTMLTCTSLLIWLMFVE